MNSKQYTFSDFTKKTVINVGDGRELGHVCDLIFNNFGNILAIIVPGKKSLFKSLTSAENLIIPFNRIVRIGSDVILTDYMGCMATACQTPSPRPQPAYTARRAPEQAYAQSYVQESDEGEYSAQAYSIPAEPTYRPEEAPPPPVSDAPASSAQTYYHAE